jgi:septal ring factor EnvC (AmiA/AmiB activator)
MSKDKQIVNVKSNGLRNELKEIRKSIDALTNALIAMQQTHKQNENTNYYGSSSASQLRYHKARSITGGEADTFQGID